MSASDVKVTRVERPADVLIRAMEMADEMENVIVIYQRKIDCPSPNAAFLGTVESGDMTMERANYLVDSYKIWLWSGFRNVSEE